MDEARQEELKHWHWPFQRINSGESREYECPHGVGHGGMHGCDGCPCDIKSLVRAWRTTTPCEICGKKPIEYHNSDHVLKPWTRVSSLIQKSSPERVIKEIGRCAKLCRSCHMIVDGRLRELHKNKPNKKGKRFPAKKCLICGKRAKPSRKGLCYSCYEQHRVGSRRYAGHQLSRGCFPRAKP